jgi:hypothetical protein
MLYTQQWAANLAKIDYLKRIQLGEDLTHARVMRACKFK